MLRKVILLDIDGVLVTTPSWKTPDLDVDGFMKFNDKAAKNLSKIVTTTSADIILTTTHKNNYSLAKWKEIMNRRHIDVRKVFILDSLGALSNQNDRLQEILNWVDTNSDNKVFVIIDDDARLENLPGNIKEKWVRTKPQIGLDEEATIKALNILSEAAF